MRNELHEALMDLVGVVNRPQPDQYLLNLAGVSLDRALFPLLVRIGLRGPLGVVDLAELAGRDHSTVSRQVAKLESLGLVERRAGATDARVREAVVTPAGQAMVDTIGQARSRMYAAVLADWTEEDKATLTRLLRRLADRAKEWVDAGDPHPPGNKGADKP
ncbi:MarR family winged helix-turn-helix transcriptional regulator [Nitrospirillum sp. BR 11163]|uniref:MarR family winged helix-turn-helix transcriptional regulator n=1 Tax=Nitrospirillum sp. BR 11163 TaxID=3104323 RepID=UPI002AFF8F1D|nr:MarR family winged helix-turn-helix transcriptional regulator [Nitrospirillum sp. BR 11163]MEA1674957.1 MarR family winged helix-turn-helix transcriptional regulator [Nitrospirillum sp. BR 11163]